MAAQHTEQALFDGDRPFPLISACDHCAGTEKTVDRARPCRPSG